MQENSKEASKIYARAISEEKYNQGIEKLSELIDTNLNISNALQLRAHLYTLVNNKVQAKRDLNEAITLDPQSSGLFYDRGCLHQQLKEYNLALKDFCEAVNLAHIAGDSELIYATEHHFTEILEEMVS